MFHRIIVVFLFLLFGGMANAVPLSDLVSEQAEYQMGYEMPENGQFDISFFNIDDFDVSHISDFVMDKGTGKFVVEAVKDDGETVRIAGLAILLVEVPVALRKIMPSEIITESDIVLDKVHYNRVSPLAILDTNLIVGYQVRRMLSQGKPIIESSITPPIVVSKGERVTIIYKDNAMTLTAPGKSLDEGYKGKEVRIVNLVSNKTVLGVAIEDGIVEIQN